MDDRKDEQVLLDSDRVSTLEKEKSSSFSSSSGSSLENDFIQLDTQEIDKSISGDEDIHRSNSAGEDAQLASGVDSQDDKTTTPNRYSARLDVGNLVDSYPVGVKQSPPPQMMVRSDVPDPDRIPSSIFERTKSTSPIEWSTASNESLFSIYAGNSGFSGDYGLLGRSGELSNFSNSPPGVYPPIPPLLDPKVKEDSSNGCRQDVATEANAEAMKDVLRAAAEGHANKGNPPPQGINHSSSIPRQSDSSTNSFAFPILTEGDNSAKLKPEHQRNSQQQTKAASLKKTPDVVPDAEQSKGFPCFSCSFCC